MTGLFTSIEGSTLAAWVRESPSIWAYATILTLHTVGLAIVVGANVVVDLRLLGWAKDIPAHALRGLFPIMWTGFAINFASGLLLFMADATTKSGQRVFWVKLACITTALLVAGRIATRLRRQGVGDQGSGIGDQGSGIGDQGSGTGEAAVVSNDTAQLQTLAWLSLVLWAGAIVSGRLMAYL